MDTHCSRGHMINVQMPTGAGHPRWGEGQPPNAGWAVSHLPAEISNGDGELDMFTASLAPHLTEAAELRFARGWLFSWITRLTAQADFLMIVSNRRSLIFCPRSEQRAEWPTVFLLRRSLCKHTWFLSVWLIIHRGKVRLLCSP